jgi:[ribosomal protein S18]-alanine N-acetyltransferase
VGEGDARATGGTRARRVIRARTPYSERIATSASLNSNKCVAITLRDFRAGEFQLLWQLDQQCFPRGIAYTQRELKHYMEAPGTFTIVAEADGREAPDIAGFLVGQRHKRGLGHVVTIDVNPEFRREGVGTVMMQAAEQRLRSEGCHSIFLETAVDNETAISFYKRRGYTVLRTLPGYYMGDLDAFLMGKSLLDSATKRRTKTTR